ncbi:hypothetical protein BBBOND_0404340 [Babesia bigemina]|uniref:Uncharacterized protein n=1 Tax=Babesia bigemina TaxID=5866 RepID=A0A061DB80_BABBI|nr:hypothetical protein BBBOND_0404340 [Babesia bigemina]CDR97946.1 hypothetical protein BBBOND_0404340 [Babesia bigemina]|eukprot:XP_012770132.1 hypothetical protein BBBOND_0404340 [Babesia bigemina]
MAYCSATFDAFAPHSDTSSAFQAATKESENVPSNASSNRVTPRLFSVSTSSTDTHVAIKAITDNTHTLPETVLSRPASESQPSAPDGVSTSLRPMQRSTGPTR